VSEEKQKTYHGVVARYHFHDARWFAVIGWAPFIIAFAGMATSNISYLGLTFDIGSFLGLGSFVLTEGMLMIPLYFFVSMLFFVGGIEWYVLCRHCPCYEYSGREHGNEKRFYCLGNWGSPKPFKYKPGHISRAGQATFLGFVAFYLLFPMLYFLNRWEFLLFQVSFVVIFLVTLRHWACSSCPNFGCILNCVPEDQRQKFLEACERGEVYQ
jgi:hypothetical protein